MGKMTNPKSKKVLRSVRDLPTSGYLSQSSTGVIYLELDDGYISKPLEVLRPYGYTRPPPPTGARITIVNQREAEDNELQVGGLDIELGQKVDFKIVKAFYSYQRPRQQGTEAMYKLKVRSSHLGRIRKHLTGRRKPRGGFFITVGVKSSLNNQEDKDILDLDNIENEVEGSDAVKEAYKQKKKSNVKDKKMKKTRKGVEPSSSSSSSSPSSSSSSESSSDEDIENEESTLIWTVMIILVAVSIGIHMSKNHSDQ